MEKDTQEKNLIERNENNIFGRIKNFFKKTFSVKKEFIQNPVNVISESDIEKSDVYREYIEIAGEDGFELFDLQNKYRNGEIKDEDLTQEQINSLCKLYDMQIKNLKQSIASKEKQLTKYKNRRNA